MTYLFLLDLVVPRWQLRANYSAKGRGAQEPSGTRTTLGFCSSDLYTDFLKPLFKMMRPVVMRVLSGNRSAVAPFFSRAFATKEGQLPW